MLRDAVNIRKWGYYVKNKSAAGYESGGGDVEYTSSVKRRGMAWNPLERPEDVESLIGYAAYWNSYLNLSFYGEESDQRYKWGKRSIMNRLTL